MKIIDQLPTIPVYRIAWMIAAIICMAVSSTATTFTWNDNGDDWFDGNNWSGGSGYPTNGDDAIVNSGTIFLTNTTADLAAFTMGGGTVTFSNWNARISATNVSLTSGTLTHVENNDTASPWVPTARVWLSCSNFFMASGASINAANKGYLPNSSFWASGRGPGAGSGDSNYGGACGAGHGGHGGKANPAGGSIYGDAFAPTNPGSAGANRSSVAGKGGGAVLIEAGGTVTVNGAITTDGQSVTRGGGSGGSIYITCNTFHGTNGTLSAKGGASSGGHGGGGGGRIAVVYDTTAQAAVEDHSVIMTVRSGASSSSTIDQDGDIGTLYFPDTRFLTESPAHDGQWIIPGFTNWSPDSFTVSNVWVRFPTNGFSLRTTNDFIIIGSLGRYDIGANKYDGFEGHYSDMSPPSLYVGGDLILTNAGELYVYSAATNPPGTNFGAVVSVTGTVVVASGSQIEVHAHPSNGGTARFSVSNLLVAAGATVDAYATGYIRNSGFWSSGKGLGKGSGNSDYGGAGGAGHGGHGGRRGNMGTTYGEYTAPIQPGSSGGNNSKRGGRGAGAFIVVAQGSVTVDGTITAGGETSDRGGGSGGSVYITCDTFLGSNGTVTADGGNATAGHGAGGGGRIAIVYNTVAQAAAPANSVRFSVRGGTSSSANLHEDADLGTLYFPDTQFLKGGTMAHTGWWRIPGLTNWAPDSLILSNQWIKFASEGFVLGITNSLSIIGSSGRLDMGGDTHYYLDGSYSSYTSPLVLTVGGHLTMTNGASLWFYAAETNPAAPDYGGLADVVGNITLEGSSWIYPHSHRVNGGSVEFRMNNTLISANSGFDADWLGYRSIPGWYKYGRGSGGGTGSSSATRGGGGGYGGEGGNNLAGYGLTYGSSNAPTQPGSSGGSFGQLQAGHGGGCVRIMAVREVRVDGTITADGRDGYGKTSWGGGGAGGGIYIRCIKFNGAGTGNISADGGDSGSRGGGGGGRIAIYRAFHLYAGTVSVALGSGTAEDGEVGTIVWGETAVPGTVFVLR